MNCDPTESAIEIWRAGLASVRSDRAVRDRIDVRGNSLVIAEETFQIDDVDRICVVGAGKAGRGMTAGLLAGLDQLMLGDRLAGWVNVPADAERAGPGDARVTLHAARPAGVNLPTPAAVAGTRRIVEMVETLGPRDLCVCLLSGGGSALLPLPTEDITLDQKIQLTRDLSAAGATIQQLNEVRRHYSQIKAGGLAKRCRAGHLVTLIISDVIGDPLDVIASGPTVLQHGGAEDLSAVCEQLASMNASESLQFVERIRARPSIASDTKVECKVTNKIIANNQKAVAAAAAHARALGYQCEILPSEMPTTTADEMGAHLARQLISRVRDSDGPICFVSGGEPVVRLAPDHGRGGRNQQLVLAALQSLKEESLDCDFSILSGGTDGEDGPTDCAGAFCDRQVLRKCEGSGLSPAAHLARNDAYSFFEQVGGLFKTGPTDTNVCDVRVITVTC